MPLMETIKNSPVVKLRNLETSFCQAGRSMKMLSIRKEPDGSAGIFITENGNEIVFSLDKHQVEHVINLLLNAGPGSTDSTNDNRQMNMGNRVQ